ISLKASAILPSMPTLSLGNRTEKSPSLADCSACRRNPKLCWDGGDSLPFLCLSAVPPSALAMTPPRRARSHVEAGRRRRPERKASQSTERATAVRGALPETHSENVPCLVPLRNCLLHFS